MSETPTTPRQEAFVIWCGEGEQNADKTALLCGVSRRTIYSWMKADEWRARWINATGPEAEAAAQQGKQMMRAAIPMLARRLIHIIGGEKPLRTFDGTVIRDDAGNPIMVYAEEARDAIQAGKLMALYGLGSPLSVTEVGDTSILANYSTNEPGPDIPLGEQSFEQLRAEVSQAIEATVSAVNTRTSSSKTRRRV